MNKLQEIFKAWNIAFDPDNEQAELAAERIEICNSCEFKTTTLGINRCSVCGCALKAKVFSPVKGACPKGKWDLVDKLVAPPATINVEEVVTKEEVLNETQVNPVEEFRINNSENTIFVQIASYRDPQLLPTLDDLFDKADFPDNLKVCIAWQHSEKDTWDNLDKYKDDSRVIILDIPYSKSKGACWARNAIQGQYSNEKYTLQLDSHHRFIKGWDTELINMYEDLKLDGVKKPLLTGYISSFDPDNDPKGRVTDPWWMTFDRFTPEGVVFFLPATIPGWQSMVKPIPARFYSAHFAFTTGEFCLEVPHDPEFYFHGEEITIAVRAFTHGYDLFHPHKVIAWHEYTRKGRTKHWDDSKDWVKINKHTHKKTRMLLNVDGEGDLEVQNSPYGLGTVRTIQDYERFAGIRFKDRGVQEYTRQNNFAPNPPVEDYENSFFSKFRHCIDVHISSVPEKDYEYWVVAFHDSNDNTLFRQDSNEQEVKAFLESSKNKDGWINIWREYQGPVPDYYVVWPYSKSKGWCDRITGNLKE